MQNQNKVLPLIQQNNKDMTTQELNTAKKYTDKELLDLVKSKFGIEINGDAYHSRIYVLLNGVKGKLVLQGSFNGESFGDFKQGFVVETVKGQDYDGKTFFGYEDKTKILIHVYNGEETDEAFDLLGEFCNRYYRIVREIGNIN